MRTMIMAAGLGTRLWPLTGHLPKPMAPIANRPALYHVLQLLRRYGITEVVVNLHHLPGAVTAWFGDGSSLGLSLRYAYEEELLGTAGGVKNNQEFLGEDTFLVMSGDSLTDLDLGALLAEHRAKGGVATLAVKPVDDPSRYGVVVRDADGRVTGFQEKPPVEQARSNLCNAGIYVFEPEIFERIPAATFYDFGTQVFPELLRSGVPFYVHETPRYWNDVGNPDAYRQGNFDALSGRVQVDLPGGEIAPGVRVGARTVVASSARFEGPVLLGDDCVVEQQVVIRGPTIIGDHCTLGRGARLESVIAWGGVCVGRDCRLARTILARDVRLGPRVRADGAVVGGRAVVAGDLDLGDCCLEPEDWRLESEHPDRGTGRVESEAG